MLPSHRRADIDGLRAIAVLSIVGFHAFSFWFPGGFVGVDVFFVISGYLISGIIFRARSDGEFDYLAFYARRIRRLFPSLIVVLVACLCAGYWLLFSTEFSRMAGNVAAATAFLANFMLARETAGYFDTNSLLKPALHLWSLSVEEQFYLIWPPIACLLIRWPRRFALPTIVGLGGLSFWSAAALTSSESAAAFYLPMTRAWELLLGSLLAHPALVRTTTRTDGTTLVPNVVSVIGLGLITASVGIQAILVPPLWRTMAASFGAALTIAAGRTARINRHLLASRLAVSFGAISYPLYLWHWPILSFLRITLVDELSRPIRVSAVLASICLAWLTYRFIEQPIRFGAHARRKVIALSGVASVIGVCACIAAFTSRPRDPRDAYVARFENLWPDYHYGHQQDLFAAYREECNFFDIQTYAPRQRIAESCTTPTTTTSVLLWGDSHAQQLAAGLRRTLPQEVSLLQIATSACDPSLDFGKAQSTVCERSNRAAKETIARVHPTVVVLAEREDHLLTNWARLAASIRVLGGQSVILVGPVPKWNQDLPKILVRRHWPDLPEFESSGVVQQSLATDRALQLRYGSGYGFGFEYVSITDLMCGLTGCRAFAGPDRDDDIVSFDYGHLTPSASRFVAREVLAPAIHDLIDAIEHQGGRQSD